MPQWAAFAALTVLVLLVLLVLTRLTQAAFPDASDSDRSREANTADSVDSSGPIDEPRSATGDPPSATDESQSGIDGSPAPIDRSQPDAESADAPRFESDRDGAQPAARERSSTDSAETPSREAELESLSTTALLVNVAASQGVFALILVGGAVYFGIPASAFGIDVSWSYVQTGLLWGTAFGIVLYIANEIAAAMATWAGFDHNEQLRELLAPDSLGGWVLLVGVVLPIIAVFEELLFRAALIGVLSTGFAIDPWLLAIVSSIAFALGHGMQGGVGVVVTGLLGFVLAAGFILTGSFLVVVVAHYWINVFEFVVHEGVGIDWTERIEQS